MCIYYKWYKCILTWVNFYIKKNKQNQCCKMQLNLIYMHVYQFYGSRSASYLGRTQRRLFLYVLENIAIWWGYSVMKLINRTILSHLIDRGHYIKIDEAFLVLYHVPNNLSKKARLRLFYIGQINRINSKQLNLCIKRSIFNRSAYHNRWLLHLALKSYKRPLLLTPFHVYFCSPIPLISIFIHLSFK